MHMYAILSTIINGSVDPELRNPENLFPDSICEVDYVTSVQSGGRFGVAECGPPIFGRHETLFSIFESGQFQTRRVQKVELVLGLAATPDHNTI